MIFTIEINDPKLLAGITAARTARNENLPDEVNKDGSIVTPNPHYLETDNDYIQFVMASAAESYSKQYNT